MFALSDDGLPELSPLVILFSVAGVILIGLSAIVAWQGRRRGYSFFVWLLAGVAVLNPLLILVVLATLPDARKKRLRKKEMSELLRKIAALAPVEMGRETLAVRAESLGDQSTAAPFPLRSIGDEETRG